MNPDEERRISKLIFLSTEKVSHSDAPERFRLVINRIGTLVLFIFLVFLSGCATYEAKPIDPSASLATWQGRSLDDPGLQEFLKNRALSAGSCPGRWSLSELTLAALYFHPDIAAARAEKEIAEAGVKQESELPNPVLSIGPGYNSTSSGISPWILTTALDFPIELPPKRSLRRKGAEKKAEASSWRLASTAWEVRNRVRKAMLEVYTAERMVSVLHKQESLQSEIVTLLKGKRDAGEASAFEASQSRLGLNQTRLSLHEAERQEAVGRVRLAEAVGVSSAALARVQLDYSAFTSALPPVGLGAARRQALTNRADILAALADYSAAEEELHLQIANQYPDINLGPGYELDQTDNKWSLGLSVELPLLNQNRGRIAEAEAARKLAEANFLQIQSAALAEIDAAVADLKGAHEKTMAARAIVTEVRQEAETERKIKEVGEAERLELLHRDLEVSAARLALIDAELGEQDAVGSLENALQKPFTIEMPSASARAHTP